MTMTRVFLVALVTGDEVSVVQILEALKERSLVQYYGRSEDLAACIEQNRPGVAVYQLNESGLRRLLGEELEKMTEGTG